MVEGASDQGTKGPRDDQSYTCTQRQGARGTWDEGPKFSWALGPEDPTDQGNIAPRARGPKSPQGSGAPAPKAQQGHRGQRATHQYV